MQSYINHRDRRSNHININHGGATGSVISPQSHDPRKNTDDVVYVNINVFNPSPTVAIPMELPPVTRTQPIINRASDYYCSVVRFDLPRDSIPYFEFPSDSDPLYYNHYYVSLSDGTTTTTTKLQYVSTGNILFNTQPVFYINQFLKSVNDAFAACNAQAIIDGVVGVTVNPPLVVRREDDRLEILVYDAATCQVWMNTQLYNFFRGIFALFNGYNRSDFLDNQILYLPADTGLLDNKVEFPATSGDFYFAAIQDSAAFYTWDDVTGILLTSNTLPTLSEYTQGIDLSGNNVTFNILTDFIPNRDVLYPDTSPFLYTSQNNRYIDMKGNDSVLKIDIKTYYIDSKNIVRQMYLPPGEAFSVKLMFCKKSFVDNEYGGNAITGLPILGS